MKNSNKFGITCVPGISAIHSKIEKRKEVKQRIKELEKEYGTKIVYRKK